ncbi:MAG: hypothetical protein RO469_05275 [Thermincola sp.]|jgi:peptidoglycan hydrolase CwlO-like protein|nr:hypothetical protein [Thermincola sp.]MDT3702994.1 hypothetical protein [Thermincola sp.]
MLKGRWQEQFLIAFVIFVFLLNYSVTQVFGQNGSTPESKGKLQKIINLQSEILQKLFAQEQKIAAMGEEAERMAGEIETVNGRITALQKSMAEEEATYAKKKEDLKLVLRSYQRMGTGSYLEIILESKDLTDFLRRLNVLRDITKNTGKLIERLQSSKEQQAAVKQKLTDELTRLRSKQDRYNELLANEKQLQKDLADELAALAAERENYQKYLADLHNKWNEFKPVFAGAVEEFTSRIAKGNLPPGAFQLSGGIFNIKGSFTDQALNKMITGDTGFPQIIFKFRPGNVEMTMPEKNLVLNGIFMIHEGSALKFEVREGSFQGIPLEKEVVSELFRDGDLIINFKPMLGGYILKSVETMDGYLQFSISPGL